LVAIFTVPINLLLLALLASHCLTPAWSKSVRAAKQFCESQFRLMVGINNIFLFQLHAAITAAVLQERGLY
jgi:hypothetical protein